MSQQQPENTPISEMMQQHPHCVTEHQAVGTLVLVFLDKGISSAPVVDDKGKPIGFVSKTDVVREIKERRTEKHADIGAQVQPWWDTDRLAQLSVGEIMTVNLYTLSPVTSVAEATAVMAFEGIHHIPVVADSGELVGMLSSLDVLDWTARKAGYRPAEGRNGKVFERPA